MKDSKIEWCHDTANAWIGCTEVHAGCDHCYARTLNARWGNQNWGTDVPRRAVKKFWSDLDSFQKLAKQTGEKRRIFVGSMMDIFEKPMPLIDTKGNPLSFRGDEIQSNTGDLRSHLFDLIDANRFPDLIFLLLTKRPSNINKFIPESWKTNGAPTNVWFGYSVVDELSARNIKDLMLVNGNLFLSMEPLLEPVKITPYLDKIGWVIVGGESGHGARPMNADWVRYIKNQCKSFNVPFLFKQWGEWHPKGQHYANELTNCWDAAFTKVGKKEAGNLLDGVEYLEYPLSHS